MPDHRLELNPANPGQFFACCGLFELSELIAPGGEAWFTDQGHVFVISTDAPMPPRELRLEPAAAGKSKPDPLESLSLAGAGYTLELNWWCNHTLTNKSRLKTWGGQQTPRRVYNELLRLVDFSVPFPEIFKVAAYTKSRFGVDARSAWDALNTGYSPNDFNQDAVTFPWVELLAVAGLQGFRPAEESRTHCRYAIWFVPLTLVTARAACSAPWSGLPFRSFVFEMAPRGQGYKTFLLAEGADYA